MPGTVVMGFSRCVVGHRRGAVAIVHRVSPNLWRPHRHNAPGVAPRARGKGRALLTIWTIYRHPADYPTKWVLRPFMVTRGAAVPAAEVVTADSLEEIRPHVPEGLVLLARDPPDDPVVFESWV